MIENSGSKVTDHRVICCIVEFIVRFNIFSWRFLPKNKPRKNISRTSPLAPKQTSASAALS